MRKIILLAFVFLTSFTVFGQDFSNKGKDFWVGYGYHQQMLATQCGNPPVPVDGGCQDMVLYFATEQVTNITVSIPGISYTENITTPGGNNVTTSLRIPKTVAGGARLLTEGLSNNGIHVTSDKPMVAYSHIYNQSVSGASILYPTNTLGREYYSVNYKNWSNSTNANCWFYVVATDTGTTTIEITPTGNTELGWVAGTTYTINLTQGQIYNVKAATIVNSACGGNNTPPCTTWDLTGSKIKSINNGTGCKKIGVFSGSGRISISCDNFASSSDNYMVQAMPRNAWGKKYLTVPANGNQANNIYRVCVSHPAAVVRINGAITGLPLINNFYYEIPVTNQPQLIEADSAIMVAQYFTSQNECGNGNTGDPEVIYLSSVEQSINKVLWNATNNYLITTHSFNVVIPNSGTAISSFLLDGAPVGGWTPHPQDAAFSYLRMNVGLGPHVIQSDSGFNAIAYGFGGAESYGYNAGTNIKDLYQQIGVQTTYGIETTPSVCTNSPFKFKVSLPYIPDSMRWVFNGAAGMLPNNNTVYINNTGNVAEDSFTVVNGRTLHWYSTPLQYTFTTVGVYPINIITFAPNGECGNEQDIPFDLTVSDPPIADFTWTPGGCVAEPFQFTETTPQFPKPTYRFWWDFGDPASGGSNNSTLRNPTHTFTTPGTYNVRYASITTPGCLSDTIIHPVVVPDFPNATISGTTAVCVNAPSPVITFVGTDGTPGYTFTYTINGGAPQTVSTVGTATAATITVPTTVAGVFTYNLINVINTGSTLCTRAISGQSAVVTVNPLPTALITGTTSVCQNAASPLVTFTGASGTAPYTFTYNINGGASQVITTVSGNSVTVAAPTNVVGTFTYNLESVTDGSSTVCSQPQTGSAVITVNPLPTASIAGTVQVCRNAASPLITFTGADGTAPYTFTYNINGGANQTITTVAGNSVTVAAPTNVVGIFSYNLVSVSDGSSTTCSQAQSGSAVITVNDLPTATIAGTITVCLNAPSPNITFTGANTTAPYTFSYTINGGPIQTVTTVVGNSVTVSAPTNVAGTFTYDLVSVQDGSSTLCSQPQTGSAVVTVNPLPTAAIAGNATVCRNAASPLVTFTGAVGSAPYTFTFNINGGPNQTVTTVAGNSVTVPAPTNVVGVFTYNLVSVQEGSPNACSQAQSGSVVITVNELPTASISGTTEVCLNAASPLITFTGAGTVAPYTFTYTINGGANQTVTTVAGNSVTVAVPTGVAGTFTYDLVSVQDGSSTTCSQAQTGSAVVTVHPLPTADFIYAAPSCETRIVSFTDLSVPNVGTLTNWDWNFGDGSPNEFVQNPTHVYATAGSYTVTLIVTSSKGCSNLPFTKTVNIDDRPLAGFIIPDVCLSDTYAQFWDTSKLANRVINRWNWNFGDPGSGPLNTSTLQNPTHSYSAVGLYNVQLIVWNDTTNCRDTIVQVLQVNGSNPYAIFSVTNPTTLCANDSVAVVDASTVFPGVITKIEIWFDNVAAGPPGPPDIIDNNPVTGRVYKHLYPNFQAPLTRVYQIRYRAYSGGVCLDDSVRNITVNAAPLVQFNNMPNSCYLVSPFQITQASEIGGVPGTGTYSGPGVSPTGLFSPQVAGVGTHTILYTFTSTAAGCIDTMSNTITVLDTAHATFGVTLPSCEQVPTLFTNLSTVPATVTLISTVWDFGDATGPQTFPIAAPITHIYAGPGPYTVTMHTVSNDLPIGCLSTDTSALINIDANHHITWDATSGSENQAVCVNNSIIPIRYTLTGGATNVNFIPALPAGLTYTLGGTPLILTIQGAPTSPAGFNFSIQTTGNTCLVDNANVSISVAPDHAIALRAGSDTAQSVCLNTPIDDIYYDLSGGATGVTISGLPAGVTYTVTGNEVRIYGTPTAIPPTPGFTITTTGNSCLTDSRIGEIVVHPYPVTAFAFDKPGYCIPNAIVGFINNTTPAPLGNHTYKWYFGDGDSSTAASPSHWYTSAGPFNVTLKARSTVLLNHGVIGCESIMGNLLDIIHPQPKADFVFSKSSVCIGDNVLLTDNTDGKDGLVNQWFWNMGDGNTRSTNPITYTFADTTTYTITLYTINTHGCNSDTINKPFTVYPYPKANAGPDKFVLEGGSVQLDGSIFGREPLYVWTPPDFLTDSRILQPRTVSPKTDMTYRLTVTGKGGCQFSDDVFVKLLKFPAIPNTFTPNGDGINDQWRIDYLNTYPNNRVQVFTRTGKLVFESRGYNTPWDGTIKGKPLPFDTYYYIIEPGNGRDPITGYVTIIK